MKGGGGRKSPDLAMFDTDDDWEAEYIEGMPWRTGEWHVWDGLYDAYGTTLDEAIDELYRNMGIKEEGT